jgi:hypothetical protein
MEESTTKTVVAPDYGRYSSQGHYKQPKEPRLTLDQLTLWGKFIIWLLTPDTREINSWRRKYREAYLIIETAFPGYHIAKNPAKGVKKARKEVARGYVQTITGSPVCEP